MKPAAVRFPLICLQHSKDFLNKSILKRVLSWVEKRFHRCGAAQLKAPEQDRGHKKIKCKLASEPDASPHPPPPPVDCLLPASFPGLLQSYRYSTQSEPEQSWRLSTPASSIGELQSDAGGAPPGGSGGPEGCEQTEGDDQQSGASSGGAGGGQSAGAGGAKSITGAAQRPR